MRWRGALVVGALSCAAVGMTACSSTEHATPSERPASTPTMSSDGRGSTSTSNVQQTASTTADLIPADAPGAVGDPPDLAPACAAFAGDLRAAGFDVEDGTMGTDALLGGQVCIWGHLGAPGQIDVLPGGTQTLDSLRQTLTLGTWSNPTGDPDINLYIIGPKDQASYRWVRDGYLLEFATPCLPEETGCIDRLNSLVRELDRYISEAGTVPTPPSTLDDPCGADAVAAITRPGFTVKSVAYCDDTWAAVLLGDGVSTQPAIGMRTSGSWTFVDRRTACVENKEQLPKPVYDYACLGG